jgi:hypothetical protein
MSFVHLFTPSVINQPTRSTTLTGRPHNIYIPAPISSLFSQQHSYIFNSYHLNPKQTNQFNMSDFGRQSLGDSESSFSSSSYSAFPSLLSHHSSSHPLSSIICPPPSVTSFTSFGHHHNPIIHSFHSPTRAAADLTRGWIRLEARLSVSTTISLAWSELNVPGRPR